jgi:hypothetical protein
MPITADEDRGEDQPADEPQPRVGDRGELERLLHPAAASGQRAVHQLGEDEREQNRAHRRDLVPVLLHERGRRVEIESGHGV